MKKMFSADIRRSWMIIASAICAGTLTAAPFKADKETLLLSGFEKSLQEADYAAGPVGFYAAKAPLQWAWGG